jgi:hypothetical protein
METDYDPDLYLDMIQDDVMVMGTGRAQFGEGFVNCCHGSLVLFNNDSGRKPEPVHSEGRETHVQYCLQRLAVHSGDGPSTKDFQYR